MKKAAVVLPFLFAALLCGCWSQREPKNLSMVNCVLYDIEADGINRLVLELMHPTDGGSKEGGGETTSLIVVCRGLSMSEAIRDETKVVDKVLFGGLNKARLFSERLAKKGVGEVMDYLSRDHLTDETPLMIVVKGDSPDRIFDAMTGLSTMVGDYFEAISNNQHLSTCQSVIVTSLAFIKDYYDDGKQPVMGLVQIVKNGLDEPGGEQKESGGGNSPEAKKDKDLIRYEGLAAFKEDKLVGYMNGIEARAYNILTGDFTVDVVIVPSGEGYTSGMLHSVKTKIKTSAEGDKIKIDVQVKAVIGVIQEEGESDVSKSGEVKKAEEKFNEELKSEITKTIKRAQEEFKSDIFGFGNYLHAQDPGKWKEIKEKWDDAFSQAEVTVTVASSVTREGEIRTPFVIKEKTDE